MQNVEQLLCKMVWSQLQSMGLFTPTHPAIDLSSNIGFSALYGRWLRETVTVLARNNYVKQEGEVYQAVDSTLLDRTSLWEEWEKETAEWLDDRNRSSMVALLDAVLRSLPDILSGRVPATDILFPGSSMALVEGVYKHNPVADYFNEVLADTLIAYLQERLKQEPGATLRIFEIGAGTGGTSSMVFEKLKPYQKHIREYCYSDLSKVFLHHAEREYGQKNPFLTYRIFNVQDAVSAQGIDAGSYDVVIAANVLHATPDIRQTLRNTKAILKNRGLLLLNEISSNNLFSHLTFGLLEGWWLYDDPELRIEGCPALLPQTWHRVLESENFQNVTFMAEDQHGLGQQIIAAESDGVIRQMQAPAGLTSASLEQERIFADKEAVKSSVKIEANSAAATEDLTSQTLQAVKEILGKAIKLSPDRIDSDTSFEKYGIDSILQVSFIRELEQLTGELPKTVLFEHPNAQELVSYLLNHHKETLQKRFALSISHVAEQKHKTPAEPLAAFKRDEPERRVPLVFQDIPSPASMVKSNRFLKTQKVANFNIESSVNSSSSHNGQIAANEQYEGRNEPRHNERNDETNHGANDIAIIGISGRYPQSESLEELWQHLQAGRNCITEAPKERWRNSLVRRLSAEERPIQEMRQIYGGFLKGIDRFDYQLFETGREQVMEMTPELRLLLEVVWETFEHAGYGRLRLNDVQNKSSRGVGVFVGNMYNQYFWSIPSLKQAVLSSNGTDWHLANRVSHFFNLTGPSLAVSSACSSSMTAIHLACESLKQGSCSMAIAGGINLTLDESKYEALTRANLLGSGQESRSFGDGNGLIPGEGVGAVLLKPLAMAIRDGDPIHAVIKSSASNHSGGRQMYTAPDPKQQARLMEDSLRLADINPATIGYVESAANGSPLGDSIEVIALQQAFARFTDKKQFCALGSIKSNLGHLEAASGISQLTKVVLQLKHGALVPSIHATPINPNIKLKNTAFYLQETGESWKQIQDPGSGRELPRRSMINSFGAGGAYTNLIVEEYTLESPSNARRLVTTQQEFLIVFSAKTRWSLLQYLEKMRSFLREKASLDMNVLAQSLQKLNHGLDVRAAFVTSSARELAEQLDGFLESPSSSPARRVYTTLDQQTSSAFVEPADIRAALAGKEVRYLAQRWTEGAAIDFEPLYGDQPSSWMELPHYAFDHGVVFRFEEETADREDREVAATISCDYDDPYLKGHKVNGDRVLVGAVLASLAVEAFFHKFEGHNEACIRKLYYLEPVKVQEHQITELEAVTFPHKSSNDFQIVYRRSLAEDWKITAEGQFQTSAAELSGTRKDISGIQGSLDPVPSLTSIYERGEDIVQWGQLFRTLTQLYASPTELLARIVLKSDLQVGAYNYILNPLITNSAYLAMLYLVEQSGLEGSFIPFGIHEIQAVKNKSFDNGWLHIKLTKNSGEMLVFDVEAVNEEGETVVRYSGYSLKRNALRRVFQPVQDAFVPSTNFNHQDHVYEGIINYLVDKLARSAYLTVISDIDANFMELGLKSASLLTLTRDIESDTGIELNPTLFFEYPSLKELADFFSTHHQESFIPLVERASMPTKLVSPERKMPMMAQPNESHSGTAEQHEHEGIAIVGMSGQFAGCENVAMFWEKQIEESTGTRGLYEEATERVKGSRLKKCEEFDYTLFGISDDEASLLDQQQYLLLTQTWKAIEDAGIKPQTLSAKSTGVFIALGKTEPHSAAKSESRSPQSDAPASRMSNTLSYIFNLRGPCESYEADSSSFFVALNRAVQAIRGKECEQALVGDVELGSDHTGVILLKRLQHANEDGDPVYAVIQGTAVLHGGRGPSFDASSPTGMTDAVMSAYQITGLNPRTTGYIEAHGWNPLSEDAAQLKALAAGYRQIVSMNANDLQEDVPRYVGTMAPISAMASFIKVVMALQYGVIPGTSGVSPGSASTAVEDISFLFREESLPWQVLKNTDGGSIKRRADLNHSSPGGMNACVVLEEYVPSLPKPKSSTNENVPDAQIVILSAKTRDKLHDSARQMIAYAQRPSKAALSDAAYTLQVGRAAMEYRLSLVVATWEELVQSLLEYLELVSTSGELRSSLPMYEGSPMDDPTGFRSLLQGNLGETVYRTLYVERDYAKLALCWAQGGEVSWQKLRKGENLNKIHMPTYPFDRSVALEQAPEKKRRSKTATKPPAGKSVLDRPNMYPELLPLNRKAEGQPVFWLHGGLGSVDMYQAVAGKSDRPFYGIQARGYNNNRSPIKGIEKMASYYIEIIRSVQAKGPYELGGFSLGGMLAYEITRQLQLANEQVRTIVMIDSPFSNLFKENKPSTKTLILQTINTMLASVANDPGKMTQTLINRNEVNMNVKDEEFLEEVILLARSRGVSKTEAQIRNHIQKNIRMQRAYEFEEYSVSPLSHPKEVSCYYFRNKSGIFLGSLEPFLTTEEDKVALDQTNYWGEWQRHIPEFQLTDVEATNHMLMMMEPKAMSVITKFCEKIYSNAEAQVSVTTR